MRVEGARAVSRRWVGALLSGLLPLCLLSGAAAAEDDGEALRSEVRTPDESFAGNQSYLGEGEELALGPRRDAWAYASGAYQPPPVPARRKPLLRRQRPNTISVGVQGSFGVVRGTSRLADGFSDGPGYAFRFRYMLSTSFALGFSFENQRFDDRGGVPSTTPGATDSVIVMTTVSAEGVLYLHREREVNPYFLGGFGHASPDIVDEILGSARVNEGVFLVLGAGLERFVRSRFSLDFTLRGYGLVSNSELTTFAQVCAGIHLYPGD